MAIPVTDMDWGSIITPHRLDKTGIRRGLLEDLDLKILYLNGEMSLIQLPDYMCLSLGSWKMSSKQPDHVRLAPGEPWIQ